MNIQEMIATGLRAVVTLGIEPEFDCLDAPGITKTLADADFVIALSAYTDQATLANANLVLPIALYPENEGSFVNGELRRQTFAPAVPAPGEARPAWKILRVLAEHVDIDGFRYNTIDDVARDCPVADAGLAVMHGGKALPAIETAQAQYELVADAAAVAVDAMVRHAAALQESAANTSASIAVGPALAATLDVSEGDRVELSGAAGVTRAPVRVDPLLAGEQVSVALGSAAAAQLRGLWSGVEIRKL